MDNVYPLKPSIKVGFKGVKIILACFRDHTQTLYHKYTEDTDQPAHSYSLQSLVITSIVVVHYIQTLYPGNADDPDQPAQFWHYENIPIQIY